MTIQIVYRTKYYDDMQLLRTKDMPENFSWKEKQHVYAAYDVTYTMFAPANMLLSRVTDASAQI